MTPTVWLYVAAGLGVIFVIVLLFVGWLFAWEAMERWQRRWSTRRDVLAADWAALRSVLRLSAEHWRQTTALFDAADREIRPTQAKRGGA